MQTVELDPVIWKYTVAYTDRLAAPGGPQLAHIWRRKYSDSSWASYSSGPSGRATTPAPRDQAGLVETAPGAAASDPQEIDQASPVGRQSMND